jgi:DUF4097 and DUF4098 domain-containing protein YvlB
MKTTKIVSTVCWLITAIILIGLVVMFLTGSLFGIKTGLKINFPFFNIGSFESLTGPFNPVGTFEAPAADVDSLDINWTAGEATITPYDGDTVKVTEFAQRELSDSEKFVCSVNGGTLEVKYCSPGTMNITKKLEVLVPETIADKLDVLDVDATSAEVTVSDFSVNTFIVHETSGESEITNINAASSDVHSVSGTIGIENMTASKLTMGTVSGEIYLTNVTADLLKTGTTSGDQQLAGTFKSVDLSSVSGEISITSTIDPESIKCGTTSGDITVTIPGSDDLTVAYSTVSGDFRSDIAVRTGGQADYSFSSVSGDINLRAA